MTIEETKHKAYTSIKGQLDSAFAKGGIPNIKAFKKALENIKKRIKTIELNCVFAKDLEEVQKAELAIAHLRGEQEAWQERLDWINDRIKSTAKQFN